MAIRLSKYIKLNDCNRPEVDITGIVLDDCFIRKVNIQRFCSVLSIIMSILSAS